MSYSRQRIIPVLLAALVGVTSGVYIFDQPLKQYKADTDGTFDPAKQGSLASHSQSQMAIAEQRVAPVTKEIGKQVNEVAEDVKAKLKEATEHKQAKA